MVGENSCIFAGSIKSTKSFTGTSEYGTWTMLKLVLNLVPSADHSQEINLIAWGTVAERLQELPTGKEIKVLTWYNPSQFNGKLQDTFEVDSFMELR